MGEKYKSKKPQTQFDVVKDLADILAGYCPLEDAECVSNAYKTTKEEFQRSSRGIIREIIYPDNFDPKMKELVESIETSIKEINELSLDDVLYSLESIRESLEDMTGVNEDHLSASLAGLSVAMESTKLWHSTHYDSEHPLHGMIDHFDFGKSHHDGHRNLQNPFELVTIILADFNAALSSGLNQIFGNPAAFFGVAFPAIGASGAAFISSVDVTEFQIDDFGVNEDMDNTEIAIDDDESSEEIEIISSNDETSDQEDDVFDSDVDDFLCSLSDFVCAEKLLWGN